MPEKVIGGGRAVPGWVEVQVPSWKEFDEAIARLWQEIGYVNENKQALWDAVNQFKRDPAADIHSEFRALRDAAFSSKAQLNGPLPNDGWHVWKCLDVAAEERKAIAKRLDSIHSDAAKAFRSVIDETLHPILQHGLDSAIRRLGELETENKRLQSTIEEMNAKITEIEKRVGFATEQKSATSEE
jgi:prefoldin subunit 5